MTNESTIILDVPLPKNFGQELMDEISSEIENASRKWSVVTLDSEKIKNSSLKQLECKMELLTGHLWNYEISSVQVDLHKVRGRTRNLNLSKSRIPDLWIVRVRNGWEVDETSGQADNAFPLEEFPKHFTNEVKKIARTAAFYGVASYSGR